MATGYLLVMLLAGAVFGSWLTFRILRETILQLRRAVIEQYSYCTRCSGHGILHVPGATVRCPTCTKYRRLIKETADFCPSHRVKMEEELYGRRDQSTAVSR